MGIKIIETEHPMKWYRFAVYFQLFAFAVLYVVQGTLHLQGFIMGFGTAETMIAKYPALKTVEIVLAILGFLIAVLCVIARQLLWYFKAWGPKVYLIVMALCGLYNFICNGLASLVIGLPVFTQYDIASVISTIFIVIACRTYFANRADLFVE